MQVEKKTIGIRLRRLRENKGLSRKYVADACGISLSAVAMFENGLRVPRDATKSKLAELYNCSVETIFFNV